MEKILVSRGKSLANISLTDFEIFSKNCAQMEVIRMRSIQDEIEKPDWNLDVSDEWFDPESPAPWLIAMRSYETVRQQGYRGLGEDAAKVDEQLALLKTEAAKLTSQFN